MPSDKDGVMIILSSPSGAGKTTLVKKLSENDNFEISISHTTRQPRPNENQNEDYFFVDEIEFKRLIQNQEFLEYAKVFNNFYGTTRTPVIDNLTFYFLSDRLPANQYQKVYLYLYLIYQLLVFLLCHKNY